LFPLREETQTKIVKTLRQALADLDDWLKRLGLSEAQMIPLYEALVRESGFAAVLAIASKQVLPSVDTDVVRPELFEQELARIRSGEYATWLSTIPEPAPEQLDAILSSIKNGLPNLREHFQEAARGGPRHRRGGRPKELADPKTRTEICELIKSLREPGTKLEYIFQRVGERYGVSATTIKRIWHAGKNGKGKL
jgi:hypothetical protein